MPSYMALSASSSSSPTIATSTSRPCLPICPDRSSHPAQPLGFIWTLRFTPLGASRPPWLAVSAPTFLCPSDSPARRGRPREISHWTDTDHCQSTPGTPNGAARIHEGDGLRSRLIVMQVLYGLAV